MPVGVTTVLKNCIQANSNPDDIEPAEDDNFFL